jgi:hypothetical protein
VYTRKKLFYLQTLHEFSDCSNHGKNYQNTKRICFKWKSAVISYDGYPTEFVGQIQNHEKMFGTPNQTIKAKKFPKKAFLVTKK